MFIFPYGHEETSDRRLPFMTIGIIALCVIVFFSAMSRIDKEQEQLIAALSEVEQYLVNYPGMTVSDEVILQIPELKKVGRRLSEAMGLMAGTVEIKQEYPEGDQQHFEELCTSLIEMKKRTFHGMFAYVPGDTGVLGLLTHQFLHGGFFHLIFNMLFLWVAAGKLESIWTPWVLLGVYLFSGIVGGVAHGLAFPQSSVPLIGASGAVAGLMGAFLIRLTKTKIHFAYLHFFMFRPRWGTFAAPAYVMLPLWFVGEFLSALVLSGTDAGGTAYWAHVGGFLSGVVIALVFMFAGFEKKVLGREPETVIKPKDVPLIAFQAPSEDLETFGKPRTSIAAPVDAIELESLPENVRVKIRDIVNLRIINGTLECQIAGKAPFQISRDDVKFIAPARIDSISSREGNEIFVSGSVPTKPAFVIVLLGSSDKSKFTQVIAGHIIDSSILQWSKLMKTTLPSKQKNFAAFTKILMSLYPDAQYVTGPGPMGEHNVPIYLNIGELQNHIKKFVMGDN